MRELVPRLAFIYNLIIPLLCSFVCVGFVCDMIDSIIRQYAHERGKGIIYSMSAMIGKAQSLMCFIDSTDNTVYVDTPNKQVKEYYKGYGVKIPETINMTEYTQTIYGTEDNEDKTK